MVSDTLVYDPGADMIRAEGNVKITGQDMEAVSKRGEASVDGTFMRLSGDVDAFWEGGLRKIRCDEMESETKDDDRRILAKNVKRFEDAEMNVVLRADEVRGPSGLLLELPVVRRGPSSMPSCCLSRLLH